MFQQFWQGLQLVSIQLYHLKGMCRISSLLEKSVWSGIPLFLDFSFLLFKVCKGLFIVSVPRSGNTMTLDLFPHISGTVEWKKGLSKKDFSEAVKELLEIDKKRSIKSGGKM